MYVNILHILVNILFCDCIILLLLVTITVNYFQFQVCVVQLVWILFTLNHSYWTRLQGVSLHSKIARGYKHTRLNISRITRQIQIKLSCSNLLINTSINIFTLANLKSIVRLWWRFFFFVSYIHTLLTFSTFFMSPSACLKQEEEKVAHPRHRTIIEMGPRWPSIALTTRVRLDS